MGDLSDAELLAAFRDGDSRAFEALVRRYQRPVLAIARRFARDQDDAEDLAQRAFINAAGRAAGWRGGSFQSWLVSLRVDPAKEQPRPRGRFHPRREAHPPRGPTAPGRAHQLL